MEAVLLIGLQGAGKTSFYQQKFTQTHVRISLDALKTRAREMALLMSCLTEKKSFVVDNTNATIAARQRYLQPAKAAGYTAVAYYFDVPIADCLKRNQGRSGKERLPPAALFGTHKRMQKPSMEEGFDELFSVQLDTERGFELRPLQ